MHTFYLVLRREDRQENFILPNTDVSIPRSLDDYMESILESTPRQWDGVFAEDILPSLKDARAKLEHYVYSWKLTNPKTYVIPKHTNDLLDILRLLIPECETYPDAAIVVS